jgi:four helix bundle protein
MPAFDAYKEMNFYQLSLDLVDLTYDAIKQFPIEERFSLADQMRRSSTSVPSNIAEGAGRDTQKQLFQFLSNAKGSLNELETQYDIVERRGYVEKDIIAKARDLITQISKAMWGFRKWLSKENEM